jgi:hypothetical protein
MLKKKTALAQREGAGGLMIWELGQDVVPTSNPSSLMSAIGEQLRQGAQEQAGEEANQEL